MARLKVLEEKVARLEGNATTGASGSMTVSEPEIIGYVTPAKEIGANKREWPSTAEDNPPIGHLKYGDSLPVDARTDDDKGKINPVTGKPFVWYMVMDGEDNFIREDVVTFSKEKPQPVTPINALWPAPTRYTLITNRHGQNGHKGIDLATGDKRPLVYSGPVKGTVVQTFTCPKCDPNGTPGQRSISNAYGYGMHAIVRYDAAETPLLGDGYVFVMFAHLSALYVVPGQVLEPGQAIGNVGSTGDSTGNHLHIEPRRSTNPAAKWGTMEHSAFDPVLIYVFWS